MSSKAIVCLLTGALVLAGCALTPTSGTRTTSPCPGSKCDVSVVHPGPWPLYNLEIADDVDVTDARPVVITWRLTGRPQTRFHHTKGIVFDDARFVCNIDQSDDHVYVCTDSAPAGTYKYTIHTVGAWSPPPKDPWVVNH